MAISGEDLMATTGEKPWPPVGNFAAANGEKPMAIDKRAGWRGNLRAFKLAVLDPSGRGEVMEVAGRGRSGGGRILRRVFRGFLGPLNAALESLNGIPGVGAIKELKDFVEGAEAASGE